MTINILQGPSGQRRPSALLAGAKLLNNLSHPRLPKPPTKVAALNLVNRNEFDVCDQSSKSLRLLVAIHAVENIVILTLEVAGGHCLFLVDAEDWVVAGILGCQGVLRDGKADSATGEDLASDPAQTLLQLGKG